MHFLFKFEQIFFRDGHPFSRVLTFSTTESLDILSQEDQILIDGTFRTTPALCYQDGCRYKIYFNIRVYGRHLLSRRMRIETLGPKQFKNYFYCSVPLLMPNWSGCCLIKIRQLPD